jgi:hypothetical protein
MRQQLSSNNGVQIVTFFNGQNRGLLRQIMDTASPLSPDLQESTVIVRHDGDCLVWQIHQQSSRIHEGKFSIPGYRYS